uniref:Uncharacterized protein n=1 Tax=Opuntia streptacantha TaxID=393608 RepID=A0A7C9AJL9_OPUST
MLRHHFCESLVVQKSTDWIAAAGPRMEEHFDSGFVLLGLPRKSVHFLQKRAPFFRLLPLCFDIDFCNSLAHLLHRLCSFLVQFRLLPRKDDKNQFSVTVFSKVSSTLR